MWAYAIVSHASPQWKRHELAKKGIKVCHASPAVFDAIADTTTESLKNFNSQGKARVKDLSPSQFANSVPAFATAGHASSVLFDATAKVVKA
eukprot:5563938-Karenia_brevis.AAC.1